MALNFDYFKLILLAIFLLLAWASQATARTLQELSMSERHEQWMALHGRSYTDKAEKVKRFKIFKENIKKIESFNKAGNQSFKLGLNKFSDLTLEEFRATMLNVEKARPLQPNKTSKPKSFFNECLTPPQNSKTSKPKSFFNECLTPPQNSLDWREKGAVTDIKDQGNSACSWEFAVVAAVEGITQIKTGQLTSLSEQQLLDCDQSSGGCHGGIRSEAFQFIKDNGGLVTESSYPYDAVQETCDTQKLGNPTATITGYQEVERSESALLEAVTKQPVSTGITIGGDMFQHYDSGVFTGNNGDCGSGYAHAVTIVGYGTSDGMNYWLVKNSWGKSWGENGYMKMARGINSEGVCGINMKASYPIA